VGRGQRACTHKKKSFPGEPAFSKIGASSTCTQMKEPRDRKGRGNWALRGGGLRRTSPSRGGMMRLCKRIMANWRSEESIHNDGQRGGVRRRSSYFAPVKERGLLELRRGGKKDGHRKGRRGLTFSEGGGYRNAGKKVTCAREGRGWDRGRENSAVKGVALERKKNL